MVRQFRLWADFYTRKFGRRLLVLGKSRRRHEQQSREKYCVLLGPCDSNTIPDVRNRSIEVRKTRRNLLGVFTLVLALAAGLMIIDASSTPSERYVSTNDGLGTPPAPGVTFGMAGYNHRGLDLWLPVPLLYNLTNDSIKITKVQILGEVGKFPTLATQFLTWPTMRAIPGPFVVNDPAAWLGPTAHRLATCVLPGKKTRGPDAAVWDVKDVWRVGRQAPCWLMAGVVQDKSGIFKTPGFQITYESKGHSYSEFIPQNVVDRVKP